MAGYIMKITNNDESIEFSTKEAADKRDITGIHFKMNTLDQSARNKADAVRCEIVVEGDITTDNRDNTRRLAKWSMDTNKKTLYREVEIVVYDSQNCSGEVLRRYEASGMFVVDYEEVFTNEKSEGNVDGGSYRLFVAQKVGNDKKEVFSS